MTTLARVKRETAAAGLVLFAGGCWLVWPSLPASNLLLGAAGMILSFTTPVWALGLLALTAPFEQARVTGAGVIYTSEFLLAVFLPGFFWNLLQRPGWRKGIAPMLGWLLPFLLVLLSGFGMHASAITGKGLVRWLEFLLVLSLGVHLVRRGREAEQILWLMLLSAALSAGAGFVQFWTHAPGLAVIAWGKGEVVRAAAGFGANTLAVFLGLVFPFAVAAALFHPRGSARAAASLAAAVVLAGWLSAFSLTAWLGMAVAGWMILILAGRQQPRWGLWTITLILAGLAAFVFFHPEIFSNGFWDTKLASWRNRLDYAAVVGRMLRTAPWLGLGPGLYRFAGTQFSSGDMNIIGLITHPHSLVLSLLAETGCLGLAAALFGSFRAAAWIWKRWPRLPSGWPAASAGAMAAGVAGFAMANLTEHCLIHDRGVTAALAIAALLVLVRRPVCPLPPERRSLFNAAWQGSQETLAQALAERRAIRAPLFALLQLGRKSDGSKILELGCGPALDSLVLAETPGLELHAVDGSHLALAQAEAAARVLNRKLELHRADVRRTGLAGDAFDVVFSQGLLEHFPDPEPVWREMIRLVKPKGAVVVDVPQAWNPYTWIKWSHQWLGDWPWGWETQYSLPALKAWGLKHGLRTKAVAGYGYYGGRYDVFAWLKKIMDRLAPQAWKEIEQRTGAWWMMNVVVRMEKIEQGV